MNCINLATPCQNQRHLRQTILCGIKQVHLRARLNTTQQCRIISDIAFNKYNLVSSSIRIQNSRTGLKNHHKEGEQY